MNTFPIVQVDSKIADDVCLEMHSHLPSWKYYESTITKIEYEEHKSVIQKISEQYPVRDTQRFSCTFYRRDFRFRKDMIEAHGGIIKTFDEILNNPNSNFNLNFPSTKRLIEFIQNELDCIPPDYRIDRIMANMNTIRPSWHLTYAHQDSFNDDDITFLYYVNDSDGDTFIFDNDVCVQRVAPVKGTAVVFPSIMYHTGSVPIKHETRVVFNMIFTPTYE